MQKRSERIQVGCAMAVDEKEKYERNAKDLGMPLSEFLRRCVRVGVPVIMSAQYPGVQPQEVTKAGDAAHR